MKKKNVLVVGLLIIAAVSVIIFSFAVPGRRSYREPTGIQESDYRVTLPTDLTAADLIVDFIEEVHTRDRSTGAITGKGDISVTILNIGNATAEASPEHPISIRLEGKGRYAPASSFDTKEITVPIRPGYSKCIVFKDVMNYGYTSYEAPGIIVAVGVTVDSENVVRESREDNNFKGLILADDINPPHFSY